MSNWLNRAGEESYLHEQYVAAMLIAISGERCSMQDRTVIADGAVNIDNLELEPGCEADIQQLATEEKWVVLARKVLTAQDKVYRFEELYDRQSSHSAINFHYDVEQRVLTSRLMASPERYLPFLTKRSRH